MNASCFTPNAQGGVTYASRQLLGEEERRSSILAELRMSIDALAEHCECKKKARENVVQLLDMLAPGEATDNLRQQMMLNFEQMDALDNFYNHIVKRVRDGSYKHLAELFDR